MRMKNADELRALVDDGLAAHLPHCDLQGLDDAVAASLEGGKRVRGALCLAVGEALGHDPEEVLPAALAVELVHAFSLVHDDLPALDNDATRRGRPSTWAQYGEAIAVLAGDALLADAFRLALSYDSPRVARQLVEATLGMIGGQYLDVTGTEQDLAALNRLKTGRLFDASVGMALEIARVPEGDRARWRAFSEQVGALFQLVDDLLDGDGFAAAYGEEETRRRADQAAERALSALAELDADTTVLRGLVEGLASRTA
jgi:geranylgeranyl diphosphate synthase, type II